MSSCAGLSIHAAMVPPHFQGSVGGGASCAQRPRRDTVRESIATGISSISPTAVRSHRLPRKLLPVRV